MIRWFTALMLSLALLIGPQAQAADCSALTAGIDRDKLIYYVEDGVRADAIGSAWFHLEGRLGRAIDWLKMAPYRDGDVTEAVVNARNTAELVRTETVKLRARLAEMPSTGPSFPPVFFWPEGWHKLAFVVMDSLELQADYLREEAEAMAAGDMAGAVRINQARNADMSGYDKYFAAFDRVMVALMPEGHPEHTLMMMRVHWHGLFDLYAERDRKGEAAEIRDASLKIIKKLNELAKQIEAEIPNFEATLDGHRRNLAPFLLALSCDAAAAEAGLDKYMETYRAFLPLARQTVELLREYARIEVEFLNNGASSDLYDRYDAVAFRYEMVTKKGSEQWSKRTSILSGLIAGKRGLE